MVTTEFKMEGGHDDINFNCPYVVDLIKHYITGDIDKDRHNIASIQQLHSMKVGRGGSHIWISNTHNVRYAIIYYRES